MFRRPLFGFYLKPDEPDAAAPVAETPPAPVEAAPAAEAPAAPAVAPGPWAKDLEAVFTDETTRAQVDTFLRAHVQPHVTQLEQRYAPARELWTDLQGDASIDTYVAVAEQLYGEEYAEKIGEILRAEAAAAEETAAAPQAELPPTVQKMVQEWEGKRAEEEYEAEVARVKALPNAPADFDEDLFARFVTTAEGDIDRAFEDYRAWHARVFPPAPPAEQPPAPPVLTDGATTPPVEKKYGSFDEAMDDFMGDIRRSAPPTVGSI